MTINENGSGAGSPRSVGNKVDAAARLMTVSFWISAPNHCADSFCRSAEIGFDVRHCLDDPVGLDPGLHAISPADDGQTSRSSMIIDKQ